MNELIKFKFKGNRNYVHGSDIFNNITALLKEDEFTLDLSIRKVSTSYCVLKQQAEDGDVVTSIIKTNSGQYVLVNGNESVTERYEFDEENLVANASIDNTLISMDSNTHFTLIENVIALTKKLNYSLEPEVDGKWLFGQLKLTAQFPKEFGKIEIQSTRRLPKRFSENEILVDGVNYGKIIFIVGKP